MLIGLYYHHHHLPGWYRPRQPYALFDPEEMRSGSGHWIWSLLMILHSLESESIMAHVSVIFDSELGGFTLPKRCWVQFSLMPAQENSEGIPIVVEENGELAASVFWGRDNGTYTPLELLWRETPALRKLSAGEVTEEIWRGFFLRQFQEWTGRFIESADRHKREAAELDCYIQALQQMPKPVRS